MLLDISIIFLTFAGGCDARVGRWLFFSLSLQYFKYESCVSLLLAVVCGPFRGWDGYGYVGQLLCVGASFGCDGCHGCEDC